MRHLQRPSEWGRVGPIREIKIHVYAKRQTSDSSWEFLRIENKQVKTVQNNSYVQNWRETTYCFSWSNKHLTTSKGKKDLVTWYKFTFAVLRKCES